jgi:hypothetical protein
MSSTPISNRSSFRLAMSGAHLLALGLGLASLIPSPALAQAAGVPDAPGVAPAPIVDKPLQPAVAQEVQDERPSPQHVWVPGHWRWQEGAYVWVSAHWELPPVTNAAWVQPHWEAKGKGYVLVEGFWQDAAPAASAAAAPDNAVIVDVPPPPPNREIIIERPSPAHIWISGYWGWRAGRHIWIGGHWELPPREHAVWVEPRWERRDNGYVLIDGFWRDVDVSVEIGTPPPAREVVVERPSREVIVLRDAPPPPRHEVIAPRPSPRHVLIEGYWALQGGRQVWIASHWELPPRGHTVWVAPRWEHRGEGYVFVDGYWR